MVTVTAMVMAMVMLVTAREMVVLDYPEAQKVSHRSVFIGKGSGAVCVWLTDAEASSCPRQLLFLWREKLIVCI